MRVYRVGVQGKQTDSIVVAPNLAEAVVRYAGWYPDAAIKHVIEGVELDDVLNAIYPQDWKRQLNALLRAVWGAERRARSSARPACNRRGD